MFGWEGGTQGYHVCCFYGVDCYLGNYDMFTVKIRVNEPYLDCLIVLMYLGDIPSLINNLSLAL